MSKRPYKLLAEILRKAQGRIDAETWSYIDVGYEVIQLRKYLDLAAERERGLVEALQAIYHYGAEDSGFMSTEEWEDRWPAWKGLEEWEIARDGLAKIDASRT